MIERIFVVDCKRKMIMFTNFKSVKRHNNLEKLCDKIFCYVFMVFLNFILMLV